MSKKVIALIVAGSLLLGGVVGFAASQIEDVTAQINYGISMKLNGAPYNPTETDGSALRPLIYKGRTYLPVAALGKALGVAVKWDGDTSTVIIGEDSDKMTDFMSITKFNTKYDLAWEYTKDKELLYASGQTFDAGMVLKKDYNMYCIGDFELNPNGQYSKLGFSFATDNSNENINFTVTGDNKEVLKMISAEKGVQNIEIDISGHNTIKFGIEKSLHPSANIVLGDIYFK